MLKGSNNKIAPCLDRLKGAAICSSWHVGRSLSVKGWMQFLVLAVFSMWWFSQHILWPTQQPNVIHSRNYKKVIRNCSHSVQVPSFGVSRLLFFRNVPGSNLEKKALLSAGATIPPCWRSVRFVGWRPLLGVKRERIWRAGGVKNVGH